MITIVATQPTNTTVLQINHFQIELFRGNDVVRNVHVTLLPRAWMSLIYLDEFLDYTPIRFWS
jgi:hypothetical protein